LPYLRWSKRIHGKFESRLKRIVPATEHVTLHSGADFCA
jgi:hypothetical protein